LLCETLDIYISNSEYCSIFCGHFVYYLLNILYFSLRKKRGFAMAARKNRLSTRQILYDKIQDHFPAPKTYIFFSHIFFFMLVSAIALTIAFGLNRSAEVTANVVICDISVLFGLILFLCTAFDSYSDPRPKVFFAANTGLLITNSFILFLVFLCSGYSAYYGVVLSLNTIFYILAALYWAFFWEYIKCNYPPKRGGNLVSRLLAAGVVLNNIASLINIKYGFFFSVDANAKIHYFRGDIISVLIMSAILLMYFVFVIRLDIKGKEKAAMASYAVYPLVYCAMCIKDAVTGTELKLDSLFTILQLAPLYLIFQSVFQAHSHDLLIEKAKNTELNTAVMVSQIQPHFLYNSLTSIAALCDIDPKAAKETTIAFSDYLRANMNSLDRTTPVSFETEMKHVATYLQLEQVRFSGRLTVEYDTPVTNFSLPALSLQPLVENAVKHGVCAKKGGGTIRISTGENDQAYFVSVSDDGVGFDPDAVPRDGRRHIGLDNVRRRLASMVDGSLSVESAPGKGTKITITIPKKAGN